MPFWLHPAQQTPERGERKKTGAQNWLPTTHETDERDTPKFDELQCLPTETDTDKSRYASLLKTTYWYYGYQTAVKRCIMLELQNFNGVLELICIRGGNITQVEARES